MLSTKALQEFKQIWEREYGEKISDDFALEQAINLLTLLDAVYSPLKKEWLEKNYGKHRQHIK